MNAKDANKTSFPSINHFLKSFITIILLQFSTEFEKEDWSGTSFKWRFSSWRKTDFFSLFLQKRKIHLKVKVKYMKVISMFKEKEKNWIQSLHKVHVFAIIFIHVEKLTEDPVKHSVFNEILGLFKETKQWKKKEKIQMFRQFFLRTRSKSF